MSIELREKFIKKIIKENPEAKVLFVDLKNNKRWKSEKKIVDLTTNERKEFNLRRQYKNQLILDIEEKYRLYDIQSKLEEKKWSYEVWDTGSRGLHISIKFSNLADKSLELRNRIRKYIITYFRTDLQLSKETQWLALEWTPHLKTGKEKKLVDAINTNEENKISDEIIEYCEKDIENQEKQKSENKTIMENWKDDPYLEYVMNNIIENGDRNNIVLKNIGILLAQGGMTREQQTIYVQKIISNMPGKSEGELWGWINKFNEGQVTEYNKSEMVQWSISNDYPVLYKLEGEEELIDFYTIKQLWDKIWDNSIAKQPIWKDLCFYNLLGTVLNEKDEDYRVHLIFSSYSTSGKDEGVNLINEVLERLEYTTKRPAEVTDRTLVGSINQVAIEYNTKHGLTAEEQVNGSKTYKDPIEKGWLEDTHWLAITEAESIFRPGAHNKHVQIILRQAMDKSRRVEKGVGGYSVPVNTNTSIILTTYKMDNIVNAILHNGLFQRSIFYLKELSRDDHKEIRSHIVNSRFSTKKKKNFNKEKYIMKLLEKLREMKKWYEENKKEIDYEEGCDNFVNDLMKITEDNYGEYMKIDLEILDSMIRREGVHLHKLCVLDAVSKKQTLIKKRTIKSCYDIIMECIDSIKVLVTNQDKSKKIKFSILKLLSLKGSMPKMQIHYELEERYKIKSPNIKSNMIKQLLDTELINTFESGRKTMIMLTDKGRDWLEVNEI